MADTVYTFSVRTVECSNCGAPITASVQGGQVKCEYCGAQVAVSARAREIRSETRIDEAERLAGLKAQAQHYDSEKALVRSPEELERFTAMLADGSTRAAGMEGCRQVWEKLRRQLASSASPEVEGRLFRLAIALAELYARVGDDRRARALLETALDAVTDGDLRDILRCRLARAAAAAHDVAAAAAWLGDTNPRPLGLEVDTELRLARAKLALARSEPAAALAELGPPEDRAPLVPFERLPVSFCLRAHALAALGKRAQARAEVSLAASRSTPEAMRETWSANPGPSGDLVDRAVRGWKLAVRATILGLALLAGGTIGTCGFTPSCNCVCHRSVAETALERLRRCPETRAALGDDITWGVGCANFEQTGSNISAQFAVKGSKGRGTLYYSGGGGSVSGHLEINGRRVSLCQSY